MQNGVSPTADTVKTYQLPATQMASKTYMGYSAHAKPENIGVQ